MAWLNADDKMRTRSGAEHQRTHLSRNTHLDATKDIPQDSGKHSTQSDYSLGVAGHSLETSIVPRLSLPTF